MKIELGEDDGFLFGGVPQLVCVTVTFDDGRCVKFPYQANKMIYELYEDLSRVEPEDVPTSKVSERKQILDQLEKDVERSLKDHPILSDAPDPSKIEKGDIVKCIFLENRNDHGGSPGDVMLSVGNLYRVTGVTAGGYNVLDDAAPMKFKLFLMRHEVELVEKHKPGEKKKLFIEEGIGCPKCGQLTYCGLHEGFFVGKCDCGQDIKVGREEVKRGQTGNGVAASAQSATA